MNKTLFHLLMVAFFIPAFMCAQRHGRAGNKRSVEPRNEVYKQYMDSLEQLKGRYAAWRNLKSDTLSNPYYFPLFASPTYYAFPIRERIGVLPAGQSSAPLGVDSLVENMYSLLSDIYTTAPWLIENNSEDKEAEGGLLETIPQEVKPEIKLSEKEAAAPPREAEDPFGNDWNLVVRRPNFWKFKANFTFQFMQNHVSDNWYKGGEDYNSMLASMTVEANYNNKQKVVFSNKLETKLGFQSSKNDEEHKYKTNADLLRLTNKLGLQATKHWYYTLMLQSWTQFYRGYRANDTKVYSDFMSPFESLFSIGMNYKLGVKNFNLDATISPFACDFKYVGRKGLSTSFGVTEGRHTKFEFGSNITMTYKWTIFKNVQWQGRVYFFTDYSKAQVEWENTFNLRINKFLSTKLFLYPRFDDSVVREEGKSYIQFNEMLTVGLDISI